MRASVRGLGRAVARSFGLQARLLLTTALVLTTCLGAAVWVLDRTHKDAVRNGAAEQLRAVTNGLLSAAEEHGDVLSFGKALGDPRFGQPNSGLYAYVERADGTVVWQSPSMLASGVDARRPLKRRPAPSESVFERADTGTGPERFVMAYTVIWESLDDAEFTVWVLADRSPFRAQILEFRRKSTIGLASAAAIFIVIQFAALRWGLAPVRRMAGRIRGIETGTDADIGDDYPRELSGLARNVNRFVAYEKDNRDRYRRAMDDLAHSLKTPLAVLKNALREFNGSDAGMIRDQVERMETTVTHQLSRAAAVRTVLPKESVPVMAVAERITHALERAYVDKRIAVELADSRLAVRVDERDLLEMLGNLIENAFKYTHSRVRIATRATDGRCAIVIEDDGAGIAPADRELVLRRGTRADTASAGHGIGLAVTVELAAVYDGDLTIDDSELGGAEVRLELPLGP